MQAITSFHGIDTSRKCEMYYLGVRNELSPMSQVGHILKIGSFKRRRQLYIHLMMSL
jgi:hypothetical protein